MQTDNPNAIKEETMPQEVSIRKFTRNNKGNPLKSESDSWDGVQKTLNS